MEVPPIRATFGPGTIRGLAKDIEGFVDLGLTNLAVDAVYETTWTENDFFELETEFELLAEMYDQWYSDGKKVFSMFVRDGVSASRKDL